jgi:hypothetical protein
VVAVTAPWKAIVPVVAVRVTVPAATVEAKVVPPDWVTVRVPVPRLTLSPMLALPVVSIDTEEPVPPVTSLPVVTDVAPPEPIVRSALFAIVVVPPEARETELVPALPIIEGPVIARGVSLSPRVIAPELLMVPAVDTKA